MLVAVLPLPFCFYRQVDPDNFIYVLPLISIIGGVATAL